MTRVVMMIVTAALVGAGCGKSESDGASKAGGGAASGAKVEEGGGKKDLGPPEWKKLANLGLQVEMPASAEFMDTSADAPGGQYFTGNNECSVRVNQTTEAFTDDFDKAKAEVEADPGAKFKKWIKAVKTSDGWVFHWEAESAIDPSRKLLAVEYRRTFGDKKVQCWEKTENEESFRCTIRACESLKPL